MCGICGMVNFKHENINPKELKKMADTMVHRGPDSEGYYHRGPFGMGFRRLEIIDLETGKQPLSNEDNSIWIACNGEIYNYIELRRKLKERGHEFKTRGDTEVIIHLYEDEGKNCLKSLRGMFSFVLWDQRKGKVFAARDRFGIKPFYYTVNNSEFIFASEIKAILSLPRIQREVDIQSFLNYLSFQYSADPKTMFKDIIKLPPGHYIEITPGKDNKVDPVRYWKPEFKPRRDLSFKYFTKKILELLRESIDIHMRSDVKIGGFLSSGIDSSTIISLLSEKGEFPTFSVGFSESGYNENEEAAKTAASIGTNHHSVLLTPSRYCEMLPKMVWHQDEPVADPSAAALFFVNEIAKNYVRVVFSGEGADELFGGYKIYKETVDLRYFRILPAYVQKVLMRTAQIMPDNIKGKNYILRGSKPAEKRHRGIAYIFNEHEKAEIINAGEIDKKEYKDEEDFMEHFYSQIKNGEELTKMQYFDITSWMPGDILMKADKMSMANSLELRVPFLDHRLFELAAKIPPEYKIRKGTTKYVLRKAVKDILPPHLYKREKRAFPVPTSQWIRNGMKDFMADIIHDRNTDYLLNRKKTIKLFQEHIHNYADHGRKLWTLMIFKLWHGLYIDQNIKP